MTLGTMARAAALAAAIEALAAVGQLGHVQELAGLLRELVAAPAAVLEVGALPDPGSNRGPSPDGQAPGAGARAEATIPPTRAPSSRPLSMSPDAIRARARRAARVEAAAGDHQLDLFGRSDAGRTPVATAVATDRSSSSLSDQIFKEREKKGAPVATVVAVAPGDPLDDACRAIFDEVVEARDVELDAGATWRGFVAWCVDHDTTFATRGRLRARWRQWVKFERAPKRTPAPPESTSRPVTRRSTSPPAVVETPVPLPEAGLFAGGLLAALGGISGPELARVRPALPEARSCSA